MRARSTHMDRGDELEKNPGGDVGAGASEFRVRARFYAIRQVDGERVYDWYRRALAAAVPCGFADDRPVTDKFVTGLRPGPVADRLLGERADGLLVDLVAAAVRVEGTAAVREETAIPPTRHTSSPPRSDHVLDEIREVLKLYRYSGEVANPHGTAPDCGNGHPNCINDHNNNQESSQSEYKVNTFFDDTNSSTTTLDRKSCWKNRIEKNYKQHETTVNKNKYSPLTCKSCCNLATALLESFGKNTPPLFLQPWPNYSIVNSGKDHGYHDDSNCYCSSLTSDECKEINYRTTNKSAKTSCPSLKRFGCPKKVQCCVCDSADDKSFSQ